MMEEITDRDLNLFNNDSKYIPWLIGSRVQLRFEITNLLGIDIKQATEELFRDNKAVQLDINYPPLDTFRNDWDKVSPILRNEILELDNEDLFTFSDSNPKMKGTFFDLLSFTIEREKEIIDTLTVWRGLLT